MYVIVIDKFNFHLSWFLAVFPDRTKKTHDFCRNVIEIQHYGGQDKIIIYSKKLNIRKRLHEFGALN